MDKTFLSLTCVVVFIAVSNIACETPERVREGNEAILRDSCFEHDWVTTRDGKRQICRILMCFGDFRGGPATLWCAPFEGNGEPVGE